MDRRILIRVTAPAVIVGLVLFATCLVSAWIVNRLQTDLSRILSENVTSMEAAQDLEINMRRLRFLCVLYLLDPERAGTDEYLRAKMAEVDRTFRQALEEAARSAYTPEELACVQEIRDGYEEYQREFQLAAHSRGTRHRNGGRPGEQPAAVPQVGATLPRPGELPAADRAPLNVMARLSPRPSYGEIAEGNPIRHVVDPCERFSEINKALMNDTSRESARIIQILRLTMLLLGLGGPASGVLLGWGMARGLSRSIRRLIVRVHDMARHLDHPNALTVASVSLAPDGDMRHLDEQMERVVGRVREVVGQLQQRQRELLRAQQLTALGQLAASVAHEVRNPLTAIKMLIDAALRPHNPRPFTRENMTIIRKEVGRLEKTVQSFLDFSRPAPLQPAPCDLRTVITDALALVEARARQQGVRVELSLPDETIPTVYRVDGDQFRTVLVNLFLNALDAMPAGGRLEVDLAVLPDGSVRLRVADTGPGIPESIQDRLFTPFVSGKPTGTGLGLCISRRIVEEHGGRLDAANHPGGACFAIHLPFGH
jgi:two-component system sensor histidine kinase HydH